MDDYVVSYSGGLGSFAAAHRLKQLHPDARITLVFCDTLIEDEDLYRFLRESASALDLPVVELRDGRNPWEVFRDVKMQGNTRIAPCSRVLKREVMSRWLAEQYPNGGATLVLGIDYEEAHRLPRAIAANAPTPVIAPLCDPPYEGAQARRRLLADYGIKPPRLYAEGFPHNNCGGFCVRAGLGQFDLLRRRFPERYEWHAQQQEELVRLVPNANRPFLRTMADGVTHYITLREFQTTKLSEPEQFDFGGCGCFVDDGDALLSGRGEQPLPAPPSEGE